MKRNEKYTALGLMSGTSLDGIDLTICTFTKRNKWNFMIKKSKTISYSLHWKNTLQDLHKKSKTKINKINKEYGVYLGKTITNFLNKKKVNFIALHGHTIFHQPENNYTLQIGDGKSIAQITKIKTINNFRNLDVSLNGQGAPLVPIGDLLLFPEYKYCLNLGGFANVSIKETNTITAFDICPVNIVLNHLSKKLGYDYDKNGSIAKNGQLIPSLLQQLNQINFYKKKSPKSLSREWVEKTIHPIINRNYSTANILHTFCEHIAQQISRILIKESVLVTGGGVLNKYLLERIKCHSSARIIIPDKKIINFKEAVIFAFLGVLRIRKEINCLKSVTGAIKDNCGGIIHDF